MIWFGLIFGSGYLFFTLWGSWLAVIPYVIYSVLYASTSDSRWHESGHGTAFKSDRMNNILYEIASFMVYRQSTVWKWSHTRHHSDTIIRGRDPEIAVPRPPRMIKLLRGFVGLRGSVAETRRLFLHASGRIDPEVATYLPENEYKTVIFKARIFLLIYLTVISLSFILGTILPLMFIGLPTILGGWLMPVYGFTQHAGLQENVLDHRLNSRTIYMNRIHRFLYWNMNYHVEHHMYPLVPYHALPKLHELVKNDCPKPYNGILEAYREIIPAIFKQIKDPSYCVIRKLPDGAGHSNRNNGNIFKGDPATIRDGKIAVCHIDQLSKGEVVRFDYALKTYAVYRTISDHFYATEGICSHGNTHLSEGVIIGDMIECSKHNGRFSLTDGSPKRIPVCAAIRTFRIQLDHDKVLLDLDEPADTNRREEEREKTFTVVGNRNVATFITELELEPSKGEPFLFLPGQYVQLVIPPHKTSFETFQIAEPFRSIWNEKGLFELGSENTTYTKRNYSLASNPSSDVTLKFNVRIALPPAGSSPGAGVGSSYVFNLKPGDEVKVTGPFGDFLIRDSDREMVYLGGGAGMAPIRSHLSHLFETENTTRKVSYWYGARSLDDLFYHHYFENLEQRYPDFSFHVALSEPKKGDNWKGDVGFIHEYLLKNYLANHQQLSTVEFYLCGPPAMIEAGLKMLKGLGIADAMIAFDEF
jgi:fatty acid desaturase/NAD(P)H-flavin reductase/nitrite reductase/ring-hydroxylating ferredoxin subunit